MSGNYEQLVAAAGGDELALAGLAAGIGGIVHAS